MDIVFIQDKCAIKKGLIDYCSALVYKRE